jgi:D-xylose transport system substrate-binding protein
MRKGPLVAAASAVALSLLTGCGGSAASTARPKIGVILPDSTSSPRWETEDRPYLATAFQQSGVDYDIRNAQGIAHTFQSIADQMISSGVSVLIIVNLDSSSGKAVLDEAKAHHIATIDYDRLTLGGSAQYYVSFDNTEVGRLQGEGLGDCLSAMDAKNPVIAELNGSPTDYNATLFAGGYDAILGEKYASGAYVKGPDQSVPNWDNTQAGKIFAQMLAGQPDIGGVLAANDGIAGAVISVLRQHHLNGQVPVTGQDATVAGLQNILTGDQCMTVYKAVRQEADAVAELAASLAKGQQGETNATVHDPVAGRDVPAVLLAPETIFKDNVKDVVNDGYVSKSELCTAAYATLCAKAGIR